MSLVTITSAPITQVNENTNYAYQVTATDADGNTLTYSLTQAPSWLSINSQTGLISGTAPLVSANSNFSIIISVSDGATSVTQTYVLTVNNISGSGSGSRAKRGGASTGFVSDLSFENQQYLNQFAPKTAVEEQTPIIKTGKSLYSIFMIIFWLLLLAILIVLVVFLVRKFSE